MKLEDTIYPFLESYKKLPYPIKFLIGKLFHFIPNKIKHGSFYYSYLARIEGFTTKERNELLRKQITLAQKKVRFYQNANYIDLEDFPIIKKETIIASFNEFVIPDNYNRIKANTGGSGGNPFEFYLEKGISRPKEKAHFDWYWKKFGYSLGDKILMIRGEALPDDKLWEYQPIGNKLALSCYLINTNNIDEVIARINIFGPSFIHAYPSALKNFIRLAKKGSVKLTPNIKAVFLGSEGLYEDDRELVSSFFKTKVAHWYGHSERLIHAGNCPVSNDFHIFPFYGYAELVDDFGNTIEEPGVRGRIIATGFDNSVMPFIRYDTGDEAEYAVSKSCACGFKGKSFKTIHGRKQDYIYLNDLTNVSLTAFIFGQHLEEFSIINEIQLEQNEPGIVDIRITLSDASTWNKKKFIDKLRSSVQNKLEINVNRVGSIPKTPRGKHVFLIQNITNI